MTFTTQHEEFGDIDAPEDERPGTLDVTWAEEALSPPQRPNHQQAIKRLPPRQRSRGGLRRVLAAVAVAICLVVGIEIAPGNTAPAPRWTPATTTSGAPFAASTHGQTTGFPGLFGCAPGQLPKQNALEPLDLIPNLSCLGAPLVEQGTATAGTQGGDIR